MDMGCVLCRTPFTVWVFAGHRRALACFGRWLYFIVARSRALVDFCLGARWFVPDFERFVRSLSCMDRV
jgi:hypothetical protein